MAPGNKAKLDMLPVIRDQDEKVDGKVTPENRSLNPIRIRKFLDRNDIKLDNFDEKFNFDTALELLRVKKTKGEAFTEGKMLKMKEYMDVIGRTDWIEETNENTFKSNLKIELQERGQTGKEADLMEAYRLYHTVRKLALRSLKIKEKTSAELDKQKEGKKSSEKKNLQEQAEDFLVGIKDRFMAMDAKEKLITVGAVAITAYLISAWDSENGKKFKKGLFGALKVGGAAVGINYIYKLFSGKTVLEAINTDKLVSGIKTDEFWTKNFDTSKERAHALHKSFIYLGDEKFADLAKKYRKARAGNKEVKIAGVDAKNMSPKEIYTALDVFFSRFEKKTNIDAMVKKYPDEKWMFAASAEMAEAGWMEFDEGMYKKAKKEVKEKATDAFNWVYTAQGVGPMMKRWYRSIFKDEEYNEDKYKDWAKEFFKKNKVAKEADVKGHIDKKFMTEHAKVFKRVLDSADSEPGVKFEEVAGDSAYIISTVQLDFLDGDREKIRQQVIKVETQAKNYLKKKYPEDVKMMDRMVQVSEGVRVSESSKFILFLRKPLKGTPEYDRIALEGDRQPLETEGRDKELFKEANKFKYAEILAGKSAWQAVKLRVRFLMDSSQNADIQKILDWYNAKYLAAGPITKKAVLDKLFNDEQDRKDAIKQTGVTQKLKGNANLLREMEPKMQEIEKDAAKDIAGVEEEYMQAAEILRREYGYKARLAIIGDAESRSALKFHPREGARIDDLKDEYEKMCKKYVKDRNAALL